MGEKKLPPGECAYRSCDGLSQYELVIRKVGESHHTWVCRQHKNTEKIHDPLGVSVVTRPHEIVDPRTVQSGEGGAE